MSITNTTKSMQEDPATESLKMMIGGDRAILNQEAQGQSELIRSEVLPAEITDGDRAALEKAGVVFGEMVDGDDLFRHATLPAGWRKEPCPEDSRGSVVLDEKGRVRASIFYKAAFYDRRANIYVRRRYNAVVRYEGDTPPYFIRAEVIDQATDEVLLITTGSRSNRDHDAPQAEIRIARAWLMQHKPEWQNPAAYWDED